jgi:hypothetical protein
VTNFTFRPVYSLEIILATIVKKPYRVPGLVWKGMEKRGILAPTGFRNANFPAPSYTEYSISIPNFPVIGGLKIPEEVHC